MTNGGYRFSDLEAVVATQTALLRSARRQEQREQMGDMVSPFTKELVELETQCLLRLSDAARKARKGQIALNAITQAQRLSGMSTSFDVSREFASVLWMLGESTLAMQFLQRQLSSPGGAIRDTMKNALMYALLVRCDIYFSRARAHAHIGDLGI